MSAPLTWWAISAGTPNGMEGEEGRIRAASAERAAELYLSQRPASWVMFGEPQPSEAPETRHPRQVAEATALRTERRLAQECRAQQEQEADG